ncbi:MAG: hypothetical protein A3F33_03335 [Candidatus Woykebacteria bacterium RIFCSPHIGHO2_12_FULL_43_10]|uniref:Uncharacterized protein n=2 Tax=Candidatus Woykeibacteriota TaxID=1817899 RepID=A0A1G1WWV6_9BACT|nr:MAG: hypothetical protein A2802_01980 [Candidatus Woykebacteria bacterium RIFCSPHIGHO2_01_FULL_43_29]OGY28935.1 MAG: hypothetical protein A3F33_03335 [Candidatus Woykebacteria bacterium RIFCSPHIGHO2_12_FULL_43_10]OGY29944.1 MAG: hypothetical protein A3J50_01910 [Candidatus Woykebacteria bacterium RIFCSPHIGHO2_02_FULL_43_16b]OGY32205.1 MAG: hypothetical protein A3A61_01695 [Candidatus Woykebacteria bacterium RIFCSPLOWO2_01_FULL_43_14]
MVSRSKMLKISNKLVDMSLDKAGNLSESRVVSISNALKSLGEVERFTILKAFYLALVKRVQSRVMRLESVLEVNAHIQETLKKLISKSRPVEKVVNVINPNLLGGIRIKVDDLVFDTSLRTKIDGLERRQ